MLITQFECAHPAKPIKTSKGVASLAWFSKEVTTLQRSYTVCCGSSSSQDESAGSLFLALHQPNVLCMWNASNGAKLWKYEFSDRVYSFSLNPFDNAQLAVNAQVLSDLCHPSQLSLCNVLQESLIFLDDINARTPPAHAGKRICLAPSDDDSKNKTKEQIAAAIEGVHMPPLAYHIPYACELGRCRHCSLTVRAQHTLPCPS